MSANVDLRVDVGSLTLKNPILTASGTFGYGLEYDDFYDVAELGGICTKGLSLEPRHGNPPDRICETAAGMLNAIGLANVGVEAFCRDKLPILRQRGVTVVANVFATTVDDFVKLAQRVDQEEGVAAIELNVSCPNVDKGGLEFGCDAQAAARVTAACRAVTRLPLWVKMSPEAGDIRGVGLACQEAGADALTAINTIRGLAVDPRTWRARLANRTGGLSGPALKPLALRIVWDLARTVRIPIIGIGGVATAEDAVEFLLAGATAVQVGTANFADPMASKRALDGLADYCRERGMNARDLIGKMR
ncbi:dihydroorotate dehydrogenase [Polyangium aurulentum]|uniref:dihydroorotate dehydrogenase n=1 Tax=Polyangium aurulentum TaxID=2567896 RepID=UPI0010ADB7BF|nr:dihydroorotate dehydrogenase [Polyangium aurulentum]UQA62316.1 dihydroorotate dehydrogenase [Polyangium aurulentum]